MEELSSNFEAALAGQISDLSMLERMLATQQAGRFGEGKSYDTQVEEKLLEEIERNRAAQVANLDKLRTGLDKREEKLKGTRRWWISQDDAKSSSPRCQHRAPGPAQQAPCQRRRRQLPSPAALMATRPPSSTATHAKFHATLDSKPPYTPASSTEPRSIF